MRAAALKARGSDQEIARAFVICGEAPSIANPRGAVVPEPLSATYALRRRGALPHKR